MKTDHFVIVLLAMVLVGAVAWGVFLHLLVTRQLLAL